jgi:hypothetical protein
MKTASIILAAIVVLAVSTVSFASDPAATYLNEAAKRISAVLTDVDKNLSETAGHLGRGLDAHSELRAGIRNLCAGKVYAIDCAFINAKGVMELVEPEKFRKHEGSNISAHSVTAYLLRAKKPNFSQLFIAAEDVQAAVFAYPVFNAKNEFVGSVSMLFSPELLVAKAFEGLTLGKGMMALVLQGDGTHIFASDPAQARRNVLKSAEYQAFPELKGLVWSIVSQEEGRGNYRYVRPGTQQVVRKQATWKTVSLYDGFWRVVVTEEEKPRKP